MKKFTMISLLLFMLFFNIVPAFAESYIVQVPVSYTGPSGSTRIIFTNQETKHQSSYTIDRQTKAITLTYTSLGTYHYTVTKEAGEDTNTHYDDRTYQVIISLTRTNNDVIRKSIIVYLASDLTKLSKITYADYRQSAAADQSQTDPTQPASDGKDQKQPDQREKQSHDVQAQTKTAAASKKKAKSQAAKASAAKKKNKTDSGSKSSSSSGEDGTDTSSAGENDDRSASANGSDAGQGKNGQMHKSQDGTSTSSQSSESAGSIHTGDTTSFVQWIVLMIASLMGMVVMKKRKG